MRCLLWVAGLMIGLCGCDVPKGKSPPPILPYNAWYVGLAAPRYMEVWVESVDVLDQRGFAFFRVNAGVAGYTRKPEGWHKGGGSSIPVNNVDLPERIFLRWQSLAEQKTYKIGIEIEQWVRDEMVKPRYVFCSGSQVWKEDYRFAITLGMAPGGIVKVWVGGPCSGFIEVGRYQATVEPLGPYKGENGGRYVRMEPENKAYIEKHGIPYGTW